jgi:hypothetical protein
VYVEPPPDLVRTEYIRCLRTARPALDEQLADVGGVLDALVDGAAASRSSALDRARADYLDHLRGRRITFDQQVAELAALCAFLFLPDLWAF